MRIAALVGALVLTLSACGGAADDQPAAHPSQTTATADHSSAAPPASALVGSWERVTTCRERVKALQEAGLGEFAAEHASGEGWLPGVTSPDDIKDPGRPCVGAVPLKHGHFFTADGQFGSTDDQGDQVDDGTYQAVDNDTIVVVKEFGEVTFDYRVTDDELFLDPVMPDCVKAGCFAAQWAVAVAYPGLPWTRS